MTTLVLSILNGSSSFLQTIRTDEFEFHQDPITYLELAPLEHLKNEWIML